MSNAILTSKEAHKEAMRYIDNAVEILKDKAIKKNNFYSDKKYVRMAGNTIYNGVLEALDYKLPNVRKGKGHPSIEKYRQELASKNKKILLYFNETYMLAHMYMGYDGGLSYPVIKNAIDNAKIVIDWATA